jgi:pimeloyl-ACP methyl ester carboxylesterase
VGKEYLVAFHGYGQTGADYLYYESVLKEKFTVIAIDFFGHGKSQWMESEDFTEFDMRDIVVGIARQEKIFARKFSVCSFSMGARMARALVRTFPERIKRVVFIAPPTPAFHYFLNFTVRTKIGVWLFKLFIKRNNWLSNSVSFLHRIGILNRAIKIFTTKFISRRERLNNVFITWYAQRNLTTNFATFAKLVNQYQIEVVLVIGKFDFITPSASNVNYVKKKIRKHKIMELPQKHELQSVHIAQAANEIFISNL